MLKLKKGVKYVFDITSKSDEITVANLLKLNGLTYPYNNSVFSDDSYIVKSVWWDTVEMLNHNKFANTEDDYDEYNHIKLESLNQPFLNNFK